MDNPYQIINGMDGQPNCILRLADQAFIPFDEGNRDYQEYLAWVAEGNEALPPDTPPTP